MKTPAAIPGGGGTWKNSSLKFLTADGYLSPKEAARNLGELDDATGTSIFDPVLCELVYRWFCPPDGAVLDPFAGGSVRGIVAAMLGRQYMGVDLSARQIEANVVQWKNIEKRISPHAPRWMAGDSRDLARLVKGEYDLLFTCPPYANLEIYSDDEADISTLEYGDFLKAYTTIIAAAVGMLRSDRFACFVVGDVRGKDGFYVNFVADTVKAFQAAGCRLYNDAVLITAIGSLPIRAGKAFTSGRKLGKTHQNVLVFVKGDWRKAVATCGALAETDFGEVLDILNVNSFS